MALKLSPPSTKTPMMEGAKDTLNHNWQRWFSDLYLYVKDQDTAIADVVTDVKGKASVPGPQGSAGANGASGLNGTNGANGAPGAQGTPGLNVNVLADGGFANSVYLVSQVMDGGAA
jgi:hypothetical protein